MRAVLFVAVASGCSAPPLHRTPISRATEVLPDVPFDTLDHDQRTQFMKRHVLPAMTPLFQQHDPKKFDKVGCTTCHSESSWEMPNPELPHLDFGDLEGFEPADVDWMKNVILPAMRTQLGDPAMRCGRCHPIVDAR